MTLLIKLAPALLVLTVAVGIMLLSAPQSLYV